MKNRNSKEEISRTGRKYCHLPGIPWSHLSRFLPKRMLSKLETASFTSGVSGWKLLREQRKTYPERFICGYIL